MPSFTTPATGDQATAELIAQLTEDLSGLRNIPLSVSGINDAAAYSLTLKNAASGSKGLIVYAADGTTVLLQVDSAGVKASSAGAAASTVATQTGTETLTNKSLTSPVLNGVVTGSAGFNAWTVWTPTLNQGGAVAFTTNLAHYTQIGKLCVVHCQLTASAAGTGANDIIVGGFPVAPLSSNVDFAVGTFRFDGTAIRIGAACMVTSSTFKFQVDNQAGFLGTAPNVALANGQVLTFRATFETT